MGTPGIIFKALPYSQIQKAYQGADIFCLPSKTTKYWQEQYRAGKIPQEWLDDTCGETRALLDGTAERIGLWVVGIFTIVWGCLGIFWYVHFFW